MYLITAEVMINLSSVWTALLSLAGVVLMVALTVLVVKIIGTMRRVNQLVDDINFPLKEAVDQLPQTMESVNLVAGNLVDMTDDLTEELPAILSDASGVTGSFSTAVSALSDNVTEISDGIHGVVNFFRGPGTTAKAVYKVVKQAGRKSRRRKWR